MIEQDPQDSSLILEPALLATAPQGRDLNGYQVPEMVSNDYFPVVEEVRSPRWQQPGRLNGNGPPRGQTQCLDVSFILVAKWQRARLHPSSYETLPLWLNIPESEVTELLGS